MLRTENTLCTRIVFCICFDIQNNLCTQHFLNIFSICSHRVLSLEFSCTELKMYNLLSYCGLIDARITTPDKYLPVQMVQLTMVALHRMSVSLCFLDLA